LIATHDLQLIARLNNRMLTLRDGLLLTPRSDLTVGEFAADGLAADGVGDVD